MAPLALVANLPTRWRYLQWFQSWPPDCISCIATLLYWHYQLVLSWYLHQQESHKLSLSKVFKFMLYAILVRPNVKSSCRSYWNCETHMGHLSFVCKLEILKTLTVICCFLFIHVFVVAKHIGIIVVVFPDISPWTFCWDEFGWKNYEL